MSRRRSPLVSVGLALVLVLVAVGAASAAVAPPAPTGPTADGLTGRVRVGAGYGTTVFLLDASSGPSGEAPGGTVTVGVPLLGFKAVYEVQCLRVTGAQAVVVATLPADGSRVLKVVAVDGGAGGVDLFDSAVLPGPQTCDGTSGLTPRPIDLPGDFSLTVVDAVPQPTKASCKQGGYAALAFANQGRCVAAGTRATQGTAAG